MSYFDIIRKPDLVIVQSDNEWINMQNKSLDRWQCKTIEISTFVHNSNMEIILQSPALPIKRIQLRWNIKNNDSKMMFLGDHWERGYGDLSWKSMIPERTMPWYFMTYDGKSTHGYGVKTGTSSMCFWQVDSEGISLWLDVRNGGQGVQLGHRQLMAAVVVSRKGNGQETSFEATREFCSIMCEKPRMPEFPVYGGNNWYYAYGNSSHNEIINDSKLISNLAGNIKNRPFMVIDDGWQICHSKNYNGGPWSLGNSKFPDMKKLASQMIEIGVRPGIWLRPLATAESVNENWLLPNNRFKYNITGQFLDPSVPEVLEHIANDIKRIVSWGYKLIKHDFSTVDIFGKWGFEMNSKLAEDNWCFADRSKTTAEIILEFYRTIREAAGNTIIIGCNTIGHLGAGIFEIQRTGDDTSGVDWERTRKMGINTLAFRMPQHGTFFANDADCVGLTKEIPWELNKQWLDLLSNSGTPLFVSADPDAIGINQEKELKKAFENASKTMPCARPVDWMQTTCPDKWVINENIIEYNWYGEKGIKFF